MELSLYKDFGVCVGQWFVIIANSLGSLSLDIISFEQ